MIAPGLDDDGARERVKDLAELMGLLTADGISYSFSVGMSELPPGGSPEAALQTADQNMYKAKHRERPKE